MRSRATPPRPGFDELLNRARDLPEGYRGQICDGELFVVEPPEPGRAHALAELSAMLLAGSPTGDPAPEGWCFLTNAELAIGADRLFVADVAGFRCDKEKIASSPVRVVPAWVAEVPGGATRAFTLTAKRDAYAALGVEHLWIVDPDAHVVEVFSNHRGKWLLQTAIGDDLGVSLSPFEELHFDARDLWLATAATPTPPSSKRRS